MWLIKGQNIIILSGIAYEIRTIIGDGQNYSSNLQRVDKSNSKFA